MGSFGDRLKKEREQRSISLDDISLNTKIGTRLLRALEEERFEQLPGGIFNKGFVRAYARHVGLDEDQAIADYMAALGESQQNAAPAEPCNEVRSEPAVERRPPLAQESPEEERAAEVPWGLLALALLLVALAFASWSYYHRAQQVEKNTSAPSPTAEAVTPSGTPHNVASSGARVSAREPATVLRGDKAASTPIPASEHTGPRSSPVAQAALHAAAPLQDSATPAGMFTVVLKGNDDTEECWVSLVADGQPPVEVTLVAPYQKVVQAKNEVVVKIGSAGAVDVLFNGKKLPSQGDYGVVRTLTFHPDGLQPPPPKPAAPAVSIPR